jgi:Serine dehydrogenase proteinase
MSNPITDIANKVSDGLDADVLLINAHLERDIADKLIVLVEKSKARQNVFLLLVTPGGDPDSAYRIARYLQDHYNKFTVFVTGYCKSAGTLCVLGANEIVMSDVSELGPLDVQLYKKDEIGELSSGLVAIETLNVLQERAIKMIEDYFLQIEGKSGGQITFKTASNIAIKTTVGLLSSLYNQIDPMQVGEVARSMQIATAYGERLMIKSKNFTDDTLETLCETYPSHGFVIDRPEVTTLFKNVRIPSKDEDELRLAIGKSAYIPIHITQEPFVGMLSDNTKGKDNGKGTKRGDTKISAKSGRKNKPRTSSKRNK